MILRTIMIKMRKDHSQALIYICGDLNISMINKLLLAKKLCTAMSTSKIDYIFGLEQMANRTCARVINCAQYQTDQAMFIAGPVKRTRKKVKEYPYPDLKLSTTEGKDEIRKISETGMKIMSDIDDKIKELPNIQTVFREIIELITKEAAAKEKKNDLNNKKKLNKFEEEINNSWKRTQTPEVIKYRTK